MPVTSLLTLIENFEGTPIFVSNNTRYGGGQGASSNDDIVRQGNSSAGRRADNTVTGGFGVSLAPVDLSGVGVHLKAWFSVTQWAALNSVGLVIASGSAANAGDIHNLPQAEWPINGGFIPVWVDVSRVAENGANANEALVNEVGVQVNIGNVGGNAQNVILDAIHHGTSGLKWSGVSGAIQDFRTFEDTNALGNLISVNGIDFCYSRLEFGDGTNSSDFVLQDGTLVFPDQSLVNNSFMGLTVDLTLSASQWEVKNQTVTSSNVTAAAKRYDITFVGTLGSATISDGAVILGARLVEMTSAVSMAGGTVDAVEITQGNASLTGGIIQTRGQAGVACIDDPNFNNISNITFSQTGSGHAIEISAAGTYNLVDLSFQGYSADGTNGAAIYVSATTGTVELNIAGGSTPSFRTAGANVVISNPKTITITNIPVGLEVRVRKGAYTLAYDGNVTSGTFVYGHQGRPIGLEIPIVITVGGVGDDGTPYERRDIEAEETNVDQVFRFEQSINPSYE